MLKTFAFLCLIACIFPSAESRNFPCVYQDGQLWIVDAYTNDEVRECVSTILVPNQYVYLRKLYIHCPQLQELKSGVFSGLKTFDLEILISYNLVRIEHGIFDAVPEVQQTLHYITIESNELVELNEAQWTGCLNLWSFKLIGTKLTSLSFAFMQSTNMRELYLYNTTYLTSIDRNEAGIMGTYVFENTGIARLPQRMFERNVVTSQHVTFKKNQNLRTLQTGVFQGGSMGLYINFVESPIEHIEPDFVDFKTQGEVQIQLGGNVLGRIERAVFEPIFKTWNNNPRDNFIKWDIDGGRASTPIDCGCSLNWLLSNPNYKKWVKNAICSNGQPLEEAAPLSSDICFECPTPSGLYANPKDCSSFYQCSNYEENLMLCPEGLVFNDARKVCDWPYSTAPPCGTASA